MLNSSIRFFSSARIFFNCSLLFRSQLFQPSLQIVQFIFGGTNQREVHRAQIELVTGPTSIQQPSRTSHTGRLIERDVQGIRGDQFRTLIASGTPVAIACISSAAAINSGTAVPNSDGAIALSRFSIALAANRLSIGLSLP